MASKVIKLKLPPSALDAYGRPRVPGVKYTAAGMVDFSNLDAAPAPAPMPDFSNLDRNFAASGGVFGSPASPAPAYADPSAADASAAAPVPAAAATKKTLAVGIGVGAAALLVAAKLLL